MGTEGNSREGVFAGAVSLLSVAVSVTVSVLVAVAVAILHSVVGVGDFCAVEYYGDVFVFVVLV